MNKMVHIGLVKNIPLKPLKKYLKKQNFMSAIKIVNTEQCGFATMNYE